MNIPTRSKLMMAVATAKTPVLHTKAPDFALQDHKQLLHTRRELTGDTGLLLGFVGDVWQPANVRRILWLQRHAGQFNMLGVPVALIVREHPLAIASFCRTSPLPMPVTLLSDADANVHANYSMDGQTGLVLIDRMGILREAWVMPSGRLWPGLGDLSHAIQQLQVSA